MIKVFTIAHVPKDMVREWLQHLRNFDATHPGCHFEVGMDAPEVSIAEAVSALRIDPALTFTAIYSRKKKGARRPLG